MVFRAQSTTRDYIVVRLKETFVKRYIIERTNKAEIRREEQSVKKESCLENLWNKRALKTEIDTRTE